MLKLIPDATGNILGLIERLEFLTTWEPMEFRWPDPSIPPMAR